MHWCQKLMDSDFLDKSGTFVEIRKLKMKLDFKDKSGTLIDKVE